MVHEFPAAGSEANPASPASGCAHHFFETQTALTPSAYAVVSALEVRTYQELNEQANRLGRHLQRLGVGPHGHVGLFLRSSFEAVVAILAVLKAGAAYVPLDPGYPAERLAFMLRDSQAMLVLTQESLKELLPKSAVAIVEVDAELEQIKAEDTDNLRSNVVSTDLAYIIYTSGSTGQPKGVMVEHRSLVNYIESALTDYGLKPSDRVLQFASLSWDTSIEEIFPCLSGGATLVLREERVIELPAHFWRNCRNWSITVLNLPTAYWQALVTDPTFSSAVLPPSLRLVITGGEQVLAAHVARWLLHAAGRVTLVNTYGITEATAAVTAFVQPNELPPSRGAIPIGRPIRNVEVYVLDSELRVVPVETVGEIYVGGSGLARGYIGRPELTAERFVPNPFGDLGSRLYRTGDLGLWRDGYLEYLGRTDQQVKLRGHRIELGEIETQLASHPRVRQAAVVLIEGPGREKQLAAYVNLDSPGNEATIDELRAYLAESLPAYMVPVAYVFLDSFPLTPSGKLNRRALPAVESARGRPSEPVEGLVEHAIAEIWSSVLGIGSIGRHDNFFALGGDSLQSLSIVLEAERAGWQITVSQLFELPTIAELAKVAVPTANQNAKQRELAGPTIEQRDRIQLCPLALGQRNVWLLNQILSGTSFFNIPSVQTITGMLDVAALERSLAELTLRHEILRTTYAISEMGPVQVIAPAGSFELTLRDLSHLGRNDRMVEARRIVAAESSRSFDLSFESPLRAVLLRLAADEHVLTLTLHHIAFDEASSDILVQELGSYYRAFVEKRLPSGKAPAVQYADYAAWQHEWLQGPAADAALSYWLERLDGGPRFLPLPTDRPRLASRTLRYDVQALTLRQPFVRQLHFLSERLRVTPFMTFLAALTLLLARITGQEDIWVGTLSANRGHSQIEKLIGLFANTLILRIHVSGDATFGELVQRVRSVTLEAFSHQSLPFERLLQALGRRFDLTRLPLFQVLLVWQNASTSAIRMPGLSTAPFESSDSQGGTGLDLSTFDLVVEVNGSSPGFDVVWRYNADLFKPDTVGDMARQFNALLAGALDNPDRRLSTLFR